MGNNNSGNQNSANQNSGTINTGRVVNLASPGGESTLCYALPPGDETKDDKVASGKWKVIEGGTKIVNCEDPGVSISIAYDDEERILVFGELTTASEDNQKWNFLTGKWKLIEGGTMMVNCENPDFCIPIAYDRDEDIYAVGEPLKPCEPKKPFEDNQDKAGDDIAAIEALIIQSEDNQGN